MEEFDANDIWKHIENGDGPKEDEQRQVNVDGDSRLYRKTFGPDGEVQIEITPSDTARQLAASQAGYFQALLDTRKFTNEQAFKLVVEQIRGISFILDQGDDDDDDDE